MSPIEDAPDKNPKLARELMQCVEGRLNELSAADEVYMIEDTIELAQRARALTTEDSSDRNIACLLLANSLYQCFNEREDDGLLEEMISLGREALAIPPERHLDRSLSCSNLANSLWTRYERTGDVGLLDEVIDLQREALDLRPARHPNRASSCGNLATSLWSRYKCTGNVGLLEEVIDLEREALDLHTAGNPERAISCSNLANSLTTRYKRTGDVGLLDEVINLEREALVLCPKGDPYRSLSCGNLAISLKTRYQRTGDVGLLDEAIELQREAMILCPKGHPYRSLSCGNLAVSLKKRYLITGDTSFLNEAIDLERAALDLRPAGHPHRSSFCENLATSLMMRYNRTDGVDSLEEAIILQREALYLCPTGHPDRSVCCGNLAKSLWARYERTTDVSHLDESFALLQECVTIAPVHGMWRDLHHLTRMHLQNTTSVYDVSRAIMYLSQSLEHDPDDPLGFVISLSSLLDSLWECNTEGKYIQLTTIYQRLVNLLPLLVHPALALQPQLQALKTCTRLGSDAFVNAALAGSCSVGFETLELAQGVIWSQRLHRRDPQLKDVPEHLASKLYNLLASSAMGLSARLDHEGGKSLTSRDILHVQSSQAHSVIREIQALPGLDRFMLGETFETLRTVVSNQPVVVLVGARGHYYALVMADRFDGGCMLISIDLSNEDLKSLSFTPGASRARRSDVIPQQTPEKGDRAGIKKTESASSKPLDGQLQTLWYKVVKPVLTHLDLEPFQRGHARPRLHWCATGIFSDLPLHAAGIHHGSRKVCCSDFVVSSYTPTITSLLRAQRATKCRQRDDVSLALVAEKRAAQRNLQVIPGVDKEIESVAAMAMSSNVKVVHLQTGSTTVTETATAMKAANIVHLACHGIQDNRDATQSGFCLGDGRLTITKLMELKLDDSFLAFLSACETAKGDEEQPDQAMHLAAAMLFSGFKSVVATMWSIDDADAPNVAKWFYEELLAKEEVDANAVAYALDSAVGKLRDSGVSLVRWAPFIHMGA